ncbi:MAG: type I secretion system permease/ATPase [Alphaproteobacteria bacterium]|nr:MAG: type I secretion system permease/ATPase [Alphaproteobacteria bacterium]
MQPKSPEMKRALKLCMPYIGAAALFSGAINLLFLAPSLYMLQVYDRVLSSGSGWTLVMLTVAVALALLVMAVLDPLRARVLIRVGIKLDNLMAKRVLSALVERGVTAGSDRYREALRDFDNFRQVMTGTGIHAIFDLPWVPIYMAVMFLLHPWFGVLAVGAALVLGLLAIANELATKKALQVANSYAVRTYGFTDATLRNAEVVQAMGMLPGVTKRWARDREAMMGYQAAASDRAADLGGAIKFARMFVQSAALGMGAWLTVQQSVTAGVMFAATILLGRALAPVEQAVGAWKGLILARQSLTRVTDLLTAVPPREVAMQLPAPQGRVGLERVVYAPPGTEKAIIKGVSFDLAAGESLGVIGPSAAGKSTLARLIVGVWRPNSGAVRLDGADVFTWDRADFGRYVGYLPQDIELFAGTIRENIARFSDADPDQIVEAAKRAGVHDMILRLPQAYDTEIGQGGEVLSGGQRQRIALARALFGNPRLLVLDEPNANLDSEGEMALNQTLMDLKQAGTTIVIIAHRPSVLNVVDRVLVMRDGLVEMFGPRAEVIAKLTSNVVRPAAFAGSPQPPAPQG